MISYIRSLQRIATDEEEILDEVHLVVEALIAAGANSILDFWLGIADPEDFSTSVCLALLTTTLPMQLSNRQGFYDRLELHLESERVPEKYIKEILKGLK